MMPSGMLNKMSSGRASHTKQETSASTNISAFAGYRPTDNTTSGTGDGTPIVRNATTNASMNALHALLASVPFDVESGNTIVKGTIVPVRLDEKSRISFRNEEWKTIVYCGLGLSGRKNSIGETVA